jgi:hypothetical protein
MTGTITSYDAQQGRGQVTLASGNVVSFTWDQVCYAPDAEGLRHAGNGAIGDGRVIKVGDTVEFDRGHASTPVRIVARES